jgi:outer membrane protein TolC
MAFAFFDSVPSPAARAASCDAPAPQARMLASRVKLQLRFGGIASAVALMAALAGCAVGPDYVKPTTQLAPFHNHVETDQQTEAVAPPPPLDTWWTGFNDPMLVAIVQRALAQNLDLAASIARVQQARAAAAAAGAQLLPTVDFDAAASIEHQSTVSPLGSVAQSFPGYTRDQREYTVGAAASWEIDLFGGLRRDAEAARNEAQAA